MYSDFRRDVVDKEMEEKRRDVDRAVSTMSKEAVEEFQKVVRIMHDPSQPEPERLKKIEEIYSKLPDAIRKEFDVKLKGFWLSRILFFVVICNLLLPEKKS